MAINRAGLIAAGIGSILVWSGIKGWSLTGSVGDLITGSKPNQSEQYPLGNPAQIGEANASTAGGSPGGLAGLAMGAIGHAYSYGGAPGSDGSGDWDCSSMVNYLASVKSGLAIPGYAAGKYDGSSHGPVTGQWGIWSGLKHVGRDAVQAGDIVVWANHMGIAINHNEMVSALNSREGTKRTPIDGYGNGPLLCYGRY
jgi:cell wall-associated NlpC family hydrolase